MAGVRRGGTTDMEREQPGQCRDSRHGKSNTWKEQTGLSRRQRPGTAQHARSIPWSAHRATRGSKRWMARLVRCALSEEQARFLHVVVVVVLVVLFVVVVFVVVVVVVAAAGDGLAALELVEGERAAPRAAEEDAGIAGRRLFRGEEGDRLRVHLAEGAVRVGDAGVLRLRGGREVLHKEQLCVWGVGHVEDEGRALLLGRGDHDRFAACLSDDDRLRPGAILERALVDRLAERAGAVVLVASGAPGHGGVVHVAAVLLGGGEGVELPDVLLQLVAGVAVAASHEVGRDGADLAGALEVEARADVAVRVPHHGELLIGHGVMRPRVLGALLSLENGARVPDQAHVRRLPDGQAAAAEANRGFVHWRRRGGVVDSARADRDAHLGAVKAGAGVGANLSIEEGKLSEFALEVGCRGAARDHILELLLLLEVAVLLVVPLVGRDDVVLAAGAVHGDGVGHPHRLEAWLEREGTRVVLDRVDASRATCRGPILEIEGIDLFRCRRGHVDGDDGRVLLEVHVELALVGRPGDPPASAWGEGLGQALRRKKARLHRRGGTLARAAWPACRRHARRRSRACSQTRRSYRRSTPAR
mmetsp:Transcript_6322/g.18994  ORF Transcript_6322/g.18994 Transcript_6322/m.18994 type:complete len:588 (+) Transcript_6322:217-1980(+)